MAPPEPEPYNQLEELKKHSQNQHRELARLNQQLDWMRAGARGAQLVEQLREALDKTYGLRQQYHRAHNNALAVMAATLAAIDNTDRFSEAVNDQYAGVVAAAQETKVNLDKTLEALGHILEVAKLVVQ